MIKRTSICPICLRLFGWEQYPSRPTKTYCSRRCSGRGVEHINTPLPNEIEGQILIMNFWEDREVIDPRHELLSIPFEDLPQIGVLSRWMGRGAIGHILNAPASKLADVITKHIAKKYEEMLPEIRKRERKNWKREIRVRLNLKKDVELKLRLLRASIRLQIKYLERLL